MTSILLPNQIDVAERYNCFIVFEPASLRVHDQDILFLGDDVYDFFKLIFDPIQASQSSLKEETLFNRLSKFSQMLDMVTNPKQVVVTRFFDRIWRRYGYVSHLGEVLFSLDDLLHYHSKFAKDSSIIADRHLINEDEPSFEDEVEAN